MMKILNKNGQIVLKYEYKIIKKEVVRKNKAKTKNTMYSFNFPSELVEYMRVRDRNIYFYKKEIGGDVYITSREPEEQQYQMIKIQKRNQVSIPRKLLSPADFDKVEITVDFSQVDEYAGGQGKTSIHLK